MSVGVPDYSTESLADLCVPRTVWPTVSILDTGTNQDVGHGAVVALHDSGCVSG